MALIVPARMPLGAVLLSAAIAASSCVDIVATGAAGYTEREERRFATTGRPEVTLATFDGSIEVRSWDRPEVLVEIEKHAITQEAAADIQIHSEQSGSRVSVEARVANGRRFGIGLHRHARLIVSLPAASDLQAASGDGSIDIERVTGRIELRSGDGSIHGQSLSGEVAAHTGDGSIRLQDVDGRLDLGTGDGSIVASGQLSALRVRSGDGSVRVRAEAGSVASEDWNISTGDGTVTLVLPDDFSAELDAHTGDGRVSLSGGALADTMENTRRSIRGRLGAGGHAVRVRSGDGSIRLSVN